MPYAPVSWLRPSTTKLRTTMVYASWASNALASADHWHGPADIPGLPLGYTGALVGEEDFSEFVSCFEPTQTKQAKEQDTALLAYDDA